MLPPLDAIRAFARDAGYAIAVHGSQARDFDLIAVPWVDEAIGNYALMFDLVKHLSILLKLDCSFASIERKPHARYACVIKIPGYRDIDLSITPRTELCYVEPSDL